MLEVSDGDICQCTIKKKVNSYIKSYPLGIDLSALHSKRNSGTRFWVYTGLTLEMQKGIARSAAAVSKFRIA